MFKKFSRAFTLIELLVVIAIIGLLATLSVLALQNARINSRDAKRLADVKQLRSALELYYNDAGHYPTADEFNSGKIEYYTPGVGTSTYMMQIPSAPTPADGSCSNAENTYTYLPDANGSTYVLNFCIAKNNGDLPAGKIIAHPGGLSWSGQGSGNTGGGSTATTFEVTIGGAGSQSASSIQTTSDGGYIIAGGTTDNGDDMYVAKLTSSSSLDSSFGTSGVVTVGDSGSQSASSIQTISGGYIVAGYTDANGDDVYVAKLNTDGSLNTGFGASGVVTFGGSGSQYANSILTTSDGGYIVAGSADANGGDMYIAKLTSTGSLDSGFGTGGVVTIGDSGSQDASSIQVTSDGGYIVAGSTDANGGDMYIAKLTSTGSLDSGFGTGGVVTIGDGEIQSAQSILTTSGGGYIVAGNYKDVNGSDIYIVKLNADGSLNTGFGTGGGVTFGGSGSQSVSSIQATSDGGYIVAGKTTDNGGDMYIAKLTYTGSLDSGFGTGGVATFGDSGSQNAVSVQTTSDGGYIVVGYTDANGGDAYIVKINSTGGLSAPVVKSWSTVGNANIHGDYNGSAWLASAISDDGAKIVAIDFYGYTYTSTDSGATWTRRVVRSGTDPINLGWAASSADGTKLAAASSVGYIYTSTDSGATWTERTGSGSRTWSSITSSADGTKLAAAVRQNNTAGYIYTSTDSGATWTERTSAGLRVWAAIDSSSDGTKLVASVGGGSGSSGYIYTSTDSGATWTEQTNANSRQWGGVASSADGTKLVGVVWGGYIYTSTDSGATWTERTSAGWKNFMTVTSSADGTKLATFDPNTGNVYVSSDSGVNWAAAPAEARAGYLNSINFSADGTKLVLGGGHIYISSNMGGTWTEKSIPLERNWTSIVSSGDGNKLVATDGEHVFMSTDAGATWNQKNAPGAGTLYSITASSDCTKLALVDAAGGYVYTSSDSGDTWTAKTNSGTRDWWAITSSADGTKLAAVPQFGYVYTSSDSGATWTERTGPGDNQRAGIASSAGGDKLITADWTGNAGYIYTSADSGATWTQRTSAGARYWNSVTSSNDGTRLAAVVQAGNLYTSSDSGATWVERVVSATTNYWTSITSSADGKSLSLTASNGYYLNSYIYTSDDFGVTWKEHVAAGNRAWMASAFSSDGKKLTAVAGPSFVDGNGNIFLYR